MLSTLSTNSTVNDEAPVIILQKSLASSPSSLPNVTLIIAIHQTELQYVIDDDIQIQIFSKQSICKINIGVQITPSLDSLFCRYFNTIDQQTTSILTHLSSEKCQKTPVSITIQRSNIQ
ncbi:unnamed protein product [Rotaria sp. Silwood2]|nr:unnamed protein product [Rotaria sp. Silwood2]CAF4431981.1 unnamed protein product [Rotaria sp. Silwood2]